MSCILVNFNLSFLFLLLSSLSRRRKLREKDKARCM
uniref:Uncharacterized protein n=1 Tax=Arundo donax TaxID=35708 RepID=A0A0A9F0L4_ARUDO